MTTPPEKESGSKQGESKSWSAFGDPLLGAVLADRYEIVELIGAGGWGSVYKAKHLTLDLNSAIKIVHRHHLRDADGLKRFEQEAQVMSRLDNQHIVRITDHGLTPVPFIVMEYVQGRSLAEWLRQHGAMPVPIAIELFVQLCDALSAAEAIRFAHRDLKPANILIKANTDPIQCKILDFGLAKLFDTNENAERITATGEVLGSPAYMSPEQWKGKSDNRSDIYSLGCIMYEVLAGKPPFSSQTGLEYLYKHVSEKAPAISKVNPAAKLPPGLEEIVDKCMQKSPAHRYQTALDCREDLLKVKAGIRPSIGLAEKLGRIHKKILISLGAVFAAVFTGYAANQYSLRQTDAGNRSRPNAPPLAAVNRQDKSAAAINASPQRRTHLSASAETYKTYMIRRAKVRVADDLQKRGWNQEKAASFLGIDPAAFSAIMHYLPTDLSLDDMTKLLLELHLNMAFPNPAPDDELHRMLSYFERAIEFDKKNRQAYIEHAGVNFQMKRYDAAIRDMTIAHNLDPSDCVTIISRADLYLFNGQGELALADLNQVLKQKPHEAGVYWRRAKYWYLRKEYSKALIDEDEAMKLADYPRCEPYADRAAINEALGKLPEAIQDWQKCIEMDPSYRTIPKNLMQVGNIQTHISELKKKLKPARQ